MSFISPTNFSSSLKGKCVRFKKPAVADNLSNTLNGNKKLPARLNIPAGALGILYELRGITMFIGFGIDLMRRPSAPISPTSFAGTIQYYSLDNVEVDM